MPINHMSEVDQFPLKGIGAKAPNAFFGGHQAFFSGTTGLVSTSYGVPGVTIGRRQTGIYGVKFPPAQHVQIHPHLQVPSGTSYDVAVKGISGATQVVGVSGYAEVHITRISNSPVVTTTNPSCYVQYHNPPTGSVLDLLFYASTSSPLGY
jgi:hypothetical protein